MYNIRPTPLYSKGQRLLLSFTPKAACSFGVKWFFYQVGLYQECNDYNPWPHQYRQKIFNKNHNSPIDDYIFDANVIFLVRDPLKRAVSSYLHGLEHNLESNKIKTFLKRNFESEKYSFNEFIQYMKTIDLETCDAHFKIQSNTLWIDKRIKHKHLVRVENLIEDFENLENKLDLKKSPMNEISKSLEFHQTKKNKNLQEEYFDKVLTVDDIKNGNIPDYKYFYNQKLIDDVYNLYNSDFVNFKYKPEI